MPVISSSSEKCVYNDVHTARKLLKFYTLYVSPSVSTSSVFTKLEFGPERPFKEPEEEEEIEEEEHH